jgi:hypothetical protein
VRPQVTVTIELASLLGQPGLPAAESGWVGPLSAETARRLACDAAVTRVLVTRHPHQPDRDGGTGDPAAQDDRHPAAEDSDSDPATGLAARLRTAMTLLPRRWVAPDRNRWRWAGLPGWSPRPTRRVDGAGWRLPVPLL